MLGQLPKWPKRLPQLSDEQLRIRDQFMAEWHDELPQRYKLIERFNHGYPVRRCGALRQGFRTLEIGAGLGGHLEFENLGAQEYFALELRPEMAARLQQRYPQCRTIVCDCQQRLPMPDAFFDRVLAIHVLEHLPDLPAALGEIRRVLRPDGQFCVVIPCEGGIAYSLARNISARRLFEKRFGQSYDWLIQSEHINVPQEIFEELSRLFEIQHREFFPLPFPVVTLNLCIGLTLKPRRGMRSERDRSGAQRPR
ncbi:MAG TPA: class I SAM-dependent methyltransferase [Burkholderiaceae bacterium]|jgi:SAM-dependent methyltransferase|nr:class I SAM-dependent methyltransferase [Burkholderiaceae bacterium]